jgi:hypothetical protein
VLFKFYDGVRPGNRRGHKSCGDARDDSSCLEKMSLHPFCRSKGRQMAGTCSVSLKTWSHSQFLLYNLTRNFWRYRRCNPRCSDQILANFMLLFKTSLVSCLFACEDCRTMRRCAAPSLRFREGWNFGTRDRCLYRKEDRTRSDG